MGLQTVNTAIKRLSDDGFLNKINRSVNEDTKEIITYYHLGDFTLETKEKRTKRIEKLFFDTLWRKSYDDCKMAKDRFQLD